jgi:hypothetical protein
MAVPPHRVFLNLALALALLAFIGSGLLGNALHHLVTNVIWRRCVAHLYVFVFENRLLSATLLVLATALLRYIHVHLHRVLKK